MGGAPRGCGSAPNPHARPLYASWTDRHRREACPKRMACPRIEQAGLKARGKVMASIGANTNGMLLAAVALTGIG